MPGLDKTGPSGKGQLTGRRRGRCQDTEVSESLKSENSNSDVKEVVYGVGRGGRPRGGGKGNCYGGGNRRGMGRRRFDR